MMIPLSRLPSDHLSKEALMARQSKAKGTRRRTKLPMIYTRAAGIDVGSTFHVVAVPPELSAEPVQTFQSFTGDLYRLAHWLQQLHTYGLLRGSFHPAQDWSALRVYLRHRERFVEYAAAHIQHMQKALMQMNLQLHHVLSDITGTTGMKIMRAIVAGQHDPAVLATYRDARCKASEETIRAALTGHYRREHVFALRHALELYDSYQARIEACDQELQSTLGSLQNEEIAIDTLPAARHKKRQSHEPLFEVREALFRVLGVDLSQIDGFSAYTALKLVGECGMDMRRWPTEKHFTSWLTLAPGNKISGGKVLNTKTRRSANRAAAIC